jgi:heme exporter protein D
MSDFLAMGGYAWYVWGSYGVTFALIALEIVLLVNRTRETEKQ